MKTNNILIMISTALAIMMFFMAKSYREDAKRWENNAEVITSEYSEYVLKTTNELVSTKESLELTKKELKNVMKSDSTFREIAKHYKKISNTAEIKTEYVYVHDTIKIPVEMTVKNDTSISYANVCLGLDLSFYNGLLFVNDISIKNTQKVVLGARESNLWRTEQSIDIVNSNPCIQTMGIQSYNVIIEKKWYNNPFIVYPAGVLTGLVINGVRK